MKKLIAFTVVGIAATGLAVAPAQADEPVMVTVCHVSGQANTQDSNNSYDWQVGHEIVVPEKAYERAFANRGDRMAPAGYTANHDYYMRPGHKWWDKLADYDGSLTNADCAYR